MSFGFCEKKREKESEWKHQRYRIRSFHQCISHNVLCRTIKCIYPGVFLGLYCALHWILLLQCSELECIYRFLGERRGENYVSSSDLMSLLHLREPQPKIEKNLVLKYKSHLKLSLLHLGERATTTTTRSPSWREPTKDWKHFPVLKSKSHLKHILSWWFENEFVKDFVNPPSSWIVKLSSIENPAQ